MKTYQTYLFDFDYTLADSSRGIVICFRNVLERHGFHHIDDHTIKRTIGKTLPESFPDFITFFNFSYKPALQVSVAAFFSLIWVTHGNFVSSCYVCA